MTSNQQQATSNPASWPAITSLCPTYGRFERLRDAVACFLLQDYPGEKHLLILNDAPEPVLSRARGAVHVINAAECWPTLGHKRQALLDLAWTPLVAHWDDDDLYLPWHLKDAVSALRADHVAQAPPPEAGRDHSQGLSRACRRATCAKSRCGWWALGRSECWELQGGVHHNTFEGQMVFDRERALALGGYPPKMSGQAADLLTKFRDEGELAQYRPADRDVSYVYRWADGLGHVSGCSGKGQARQAEFLRRNKDFGLGRDGKQQPLIPSGNPILWARARMAGQFRILSEQLRTRLSADDWTHILPALLASAFRLRC